MTATLSRIDKDQREERDSAILRLHLQSFTQEEIAAAIGIPQETVRNILAEIANWQIGLEPGLFAEDLPDDDAAEKVKREAEAARATKIADHNRALAEHEADFAVPIYNVWKQQTKREADRGEA